MPEVTTCELNQELAIPEVFSLPSGLLSQLPLPPVLVLKAERPGIVVLDFRQPSKAKAKKWMVVFNRQESEALVEGATHSRVLEKHFLSICKLKAEDPRWRLTREVAIGEAPGILSRRVPTPEWTTDKFLKRIGARLQSVRVGQRSAGQKRGENG